MFVHIVILAGIAGGIQIMNIDVLLDFSIPWLVCIWRRRAFVGRSGLLRLVASHGLLSRDECRYK